MSAYKIEFKKHNQDFIDFLIMYCDTFYDVYKNVIKDMNKKEINANIKDFLKSIIDLYENEE